MVLNVVRLKKYKEKLSEVSIRIILGNIRSDQLMIVDEDDLIIVTHFNYLELPFKNEILKTSHLLAFQLLCLFMKNQSVYTFIDVIEKKIHLFFENDALSVVKLLEDKDVQKQIKVLSSFYMDILNICSSSGKKENILRCFKKVNEYCENNIKHVLDHINSFELTKVRYAMGIRKTDFNKFIIINDSEGHKKIEVYIHGKPTLMSGSKELTLLLESL